MSSPESCEATKSPGSGCLETITPVARNSRAALLLLFMTLAVTWLIPMFWVGAMFGPLPFRVPDRLWQQYSAAGLFTKRTPVWSDWRVEVRSAGSTEWRRIKMADVSPMPTSGYRQRMDRILGDTRAKKTGESLRQRLAEWMALRLEHTTGQEINGVRFLYRSWQSNTPELAFPAGRWNGDILLPATTRVSTLGPYAILDGEVIPERNRPGPHPAPKLKMNGEITQEQDKARAPVPAPIPQPSIFRREPAPSPPPPTG